MAKSRSKISRQAVKRSASGKTRAQSRKQSRPAQSRGKTAAPAKTAAKGKWVYAFGGGKAEGRAGMRNLLGGKGAGLAEMANLGLPVPPGFTITTEVCTYFYGTARPIRRICKPQVEAALAEIGRITGKTFGDGENPLLVSVRSGARASMPGMMDTVLNLGLNDATVAALAEKSGDRRFAYDSYRRFITMYADVVLGIGHRPFRGNPRRAQGPQRLHARHRSRRRRLAASSSGATSSASRRRPASRSRRTRTRSCGARSARCSARG